MAVPTGRYEVDLLAAEFEVLDARVERLAAEIDRANNDRFLADQRADQCRAAIRTLFGSVPDTPNTGNWAIDALINKRNELRQQVTRLTALRDRAQADRQATQAKRSAIRTALEALYGRVPPRN